MTTMPSSSTLERRGAPVSAPGALDACADLDGYDEVNETDFLLLAELIERRSGIHLTAAKRSMVSSRLRGCAHRAGKQSVRDYCRYVFEQGGLDAQWPQILDAVTTNKTDFFRESDHFEFLINDVVPDLVTRGHHELAVWSAACSTGPEAYTLAMVLDRAAQSQGFAYHIFASDICCDALQKAERGVYAAEMVAPVPPPLLSRYVMTSRDKSARLVRMVPELRNAVTFGHHNLLSPRSPWARTMDVVFCRNVLIYFQRATQELVMRHLCNQLRVGGYLFLGHSESTMTLSLPIEQLRPSIYRRVA